MTKNKHIGDALLLGYYELFFIGPKAVAPAFALLT